jgi:hypothetical protein
MAASWSISEEKYLSPEKKQETAGLEPATITGFFLNNYNTRPTSLG